ncbi:hypothetical protein ACWEQC_15530 [Streptomyces shenzhenensis]
MAGNPRNGRPYRRLVDWLRAQCLPCLFGLFERRASLENPAVPLTNEALAEIFGGFRSDAGVHVSEETSLRTPTVWRAMAVIAGGVRRSTAARVQVRQPGPHDGAAAG